MTSEPASPRAVSPLEQRLRALTDAVDRTASLTEKLGVKLQPILGEAPPATPTKDPACARPGASGVETALAEIERRLTGIAGELAVIFDRLAV